MVSAIISRALVLTLGTLYPAYRSYKGVKSRNVREYVKWMMYWIVFAIYLCVEALADIFVAFWLPLYYEIKIIFIIWLLSPYTKGASLLYRKFVHPFLLKHERDIDLYLEKAKRESYARVMKLGNRGINYAKEAVAMAALRSHEHIVGQIRKTVSLNDVSGEHTLELTDKPLRAALQYEGLDEEDEMDAVIDGGQFGGTAPNLMVSSLRVKRVRSVKQRPALAEVRRQTTKPLKSAANTNQRENFDETDSNAMIASSTSSSSNNNNNRNVPNSSNNVGSLVDSTATTHYSDNLSQVVDQEFGYLEGEEEEDEQNDYNDNDDEDNQDLDEIAQDAALQQHYENDPDYTENGGGNLKRQQKNVNKNINYATLPRRSQRKFVKKE